jgi:nucleotide-binding universal stress UspA family protein
VLAFAGALARKLDASLYVVHAHRWDAPMEFTSAQTGLVLAEQRMSAAAARDDLERFVTKTAGVAPAGCAVLEKDPVEAIVGYSAEVGADLLVLGTHGRTGVQRLVYGSVAEEITRRVGVPALSIRGSTADASQSDLFGRIVCPVNFTEPARQGLEYAAAVAVAFGSELILIHAMESGNRKSEDALNDDLCAMIPDGAREHCTYKILLRKGDAAAQTIAAASESSADLIVIGADRKPFLETVLVGTTTERVMRYAPIPVLVVPKV